MPTDGTLPLIPEKRKYYFNHTVLMGNFTLRYKIEGECASSYLELNVIHGQSPSYNRWIHITRLLEPKVINTFYMDIYIWMYEQTINISSWKYNDAKNLFKFHPTGRWSRGVVDRLIQDQNSEKNASCWCLILKDLTSYDLTQNPEQKKIFFSRYLQNISFWE